MPAVSKKQQRFFGYLLSNPDERKKRGISKKAAKDFAQDVKEEKKSCPEGQYYALIWVSVDLFLKERKFVEMVNL